MPSRRVFLGIDSSNERGGIQALVVDSAPEKATVVDFVETRAAENENIKPVVTEAVDSEDYSAPATNELAGEEFEAVRSALSELPRHEGEDHGYYVRHESETIRIRVFVEE